MKAWNLHSANDIRFEEVKKPIIKDDEVLIKVRAAGICGSDISRVYRDGAHVMPLIPGHEFSGEVVESGLETDKGLIGKRVGVFPLIPCKKCSACMSQRYEMCHEYSYLGSRRDGGFAEYVAVPEWNVIELPDKVSYEAAAMLEPMSVAVHAINQIDIDRSIDNSSENALDSVSDTTAVVIGLGTVGLLITMFLVEKGIPNIIAVGNKEHQKRVIEEMTDKFNSNVSIESVNSSDSDCLSSSRITYCDTGANVDDLIKAYSNKTGADIVFECVGKRETINRAISLAGDGGSVCTVGNPHSDIMLDRNVYWHILRKQIKLTGTWNSSFMGKDVETQDDWRYVLWCLENKRVKPEMLISHTLKLEELEQGLRIMRDKKEDYIKIMCTM